MIHLQSDMDHFPSEISEFLITEVVGLYYLE
jgi:hypothetical protein